MFNHRYLSLWTKHENILDLLKGKFPLLEAHVEYSFEKNNITIVECILHDFIIEQNPYAKQFEADPHDIDNGPLDIIEYVWK